MSALEGMDSGRTFCMTRVQAKLTTRILTAQKTIRLMTLTPDQITQTADRDRMAIQTADQIMRPAQRMMAVNQIPLILEGCNPSRTRYY